MKTLEFNIITLFPEMFQSPLQSSILKKGQEEEIIRIYTHNLRDFTHDKHRTTDDSPYGGGPGMVLKVEPIAEALDSIEPKGFTILLTPQGNKFSQKTAQRFSTKKKITLICGRYEGFDERIRNLVDEEISVGDYILTGGELPAMLLVDSISRLIPGVLGDDNSIEEESFSKPFLEYPQYTRPRIFKGNKVPEILLSGNHELIRKWRKKESLKKTWNKRKDLIDCAKLTEEETALFEEIRSEQEQGSRKL